MAEEEQKKMSVDDLEEYEAGAGIDVDEYEGQKVEIESYEIIQVKQKYNPVTGEIDGSDHEVPKIRVLTKPVAEIEVTNKETGKQEKVKVRGSELFNLKLVSGKWGVSTSPRASLNKFLEKLKLPAGKEGLKRIVGKTVMLRKVTKNERDWLGLVY